MLYHNLIWDFDGTLFDSYPHVCAAYMQALADFGRTEDPAIIMAKLKINFGEAHKYLQASDELRARFYQYERDTEFAPKAELYDGMKALLADTKAAGARHFLFTHRNNLALTYMERAGILGYFDGWVTADDKEHFALKPSPDSILYLLSEYGIDPDDCAMIGDREIDVGSGIAAGTKGILFDEFRNLGETKAQHRAYSVEEMRELLFNRKPLLDTDGQISHLIRKGVAFHFMTEADARKYLELNNNYFRLRAYRKNFDKHPDGVHKGEYINLDFAMLVDLSVIDMRLRYILLELVLDVEHFAKVLLLKRVTEAGEDGYKIVSDYFNGLDINDKLNGTHGYEKLQSDLHRNRNNPYCGGIIDKYDGDYPIWAFIEVIPMGSFINFFEFCSHRLNDKELLNIVYLLKTVKDLRNAAAHSNCILHDMAAQDAKHQPNHQMIQKLSKISKVSRAKKLGNERMRQITTLLYTHHLIVTSDGVRSRAGRDLAELCTRMERNRDYYLKNDVILTNFEFFQKVVDILFG